MGWSWWRLVARGRSMVDGVEVLVSGVKELVAGKAKMAGVAGTVGGSVHPGHR